MSIEADRGVRVTNYYDQRFTADNKRLYSFLRRKVALGILEEDPCNLKFKRTGVTEQRPLERRKGVKNYLIKTMPTLDFTIKLTENGIIYDPFEGGILLDQENMEQALRVTGTVITDEKNSGFDGIIVADLGLRGLNATAPVRKTKYKITTKGDEWYSGQHKKDFIAVIENHLLPVINQNIVIDSVHARQADPIFNDDFHIFLWSGPVRGERAVKPPSTIFGYSMASGIGCRDGLDVVPLNDDLLIIDEEHDYIAASITDKKNLYIYHDITHHGSAEEISIFEEIIVRAADLLANNPITKEEVERKKAEKALALAQASRNTYIKLCAQRFTKEEDAAKATIRTLNNEISTYQAAIVKHIRDLRVKEELLSKLQEGAAGKEEKFGFEYDKLLSIPKILSVVVRDIGIHVMTDTLYCKDPRTDIVHDIGKFRIEIDYNCNNRGVRWFNVTRTVKAYEGRKMQAPHVFPEGNACFGNTADIWPRLIADYEYAAVAQIAISFIESVNLDDGAGPYINRWPFAPTEMQSERGLKSIEDINEKNKKGKAREE